MKLTTKQLRQIINEELSILREGHDTPLTEFELYSDLEAIDITVQKFKDDLDYAKGMTSTAPDISQLSNEMYDMLYKAASDLQAARVKFAEELNQDPNPHMRRR